MLIRPSIKEMQLALTRALEAPGSGLAILVIVLAFASSLVPALARAQETLPETELEQEGLAKKPKPGEWSATLGAGVASVPRYQGADTSRTKLVPLVSIRYDDIFFGPFGLGWSAINWDGFHAGPVLGYEGGRRERRDPELAGLGDSSSSLTGGAFANYRFASFDILATVRKALTHSGNGLNGLVRFEYRVAIIPRRLDLRIGPHLEFANSQYEQTYFGVSPIQSAQSGYPVFAPGGGVKDVGFKASLTYLATQRLALRAFAEVKKFIGDTANSPIVERQTENFVGIGAAYHFGAARGTNFGKEK
jgi:outer membrane scaffolding protein for murein synthesis (MipA/OmpV family)